MVKRQFEVYLVALDPAKGSEIQKTRPCLVVSPDVMNTFLKTVIIAPLTSTIKAYPTRVACVFDEKQGQIATDQMRAVDHSLLIKKLGELTDKNVQEKLLTTLQKMFSY